MVISSIVNVLAPNHYTATHRASLKQWILRATHLPVFSKNFGDRTVWNRSSGTRCLVDTGAEVSTVSLSKYLRQSFKHCPSLVAVNGSNIWTSTDEDNPGYNVVYLGFRRLGNLAPSLPIRESATRLTLLQASEADGCFKSLLLLLVRKPYKNKFLIHSVQSQVFFTSSKLTLVLSKKIWWFGFFSGYSQIFRFPYWLRTGSYGFITLFIYRFHISCKNLVMLLNVRYISLFPLIVNCVPEFFFIL